MNDKFVWYTDTHLNWAFPWNKYLFVNRIKAEKSKGLFLTGDISHGISICYNLKYLASRLDIPIYFVLGNHDYHYRKIESIHNSIRELSVKHTNLHWLTESDTISLNKKTAIIGTEGWYDAIFGDPKYLKYSFDRMLMLDFFKMKSFDEQLIRFRQMANNSAQLIENKLNKALQGHKTIYILTHFPPWKEATRDAGSILEKYWLPYNVNYAMGKTIERVMAGKKNKRVIVLAGHCHTDSWIHISNNIECKVNKAKYTGLPRNEEIIFL